MSATIHPAGAEALAELRRFAAGVIAPPPPPDIVDWAESGAVVLAGPTESHGGPLRLDRTPYLREILRATTTRGVRRVSLCFGTQLAKTLACRVHALYHVAHRKGALVWALPSEAVARGVAKRRWHPVLEASPGLRPHLPDDRESLTTLDQVFGGGRCSIRMIGAGSPTALSSEPAVTTIADEADKFRTETDKEADSLRLLDERLKAAPNPLAILASTPTVEDAPTWQALTAGTNERLLVACPSCGHRHEWTMRTLKWDEAAKREDGSWDLDLVATTAHMVCPACSGRIEHHRKPGLIAAGVWTATNPSPEPGHRSYHLSTLYSPFRSWGECAVEFLRAKTSDDPGALQNVTNSWLAEPWRQAFREDDSGLGRTVLTGHARGDAWGRERLLIVDVQRADLHWLVRGYGPGSSALIDHGTVGAWEELDEIQTRYGARWAAVDTGYGERTQEAYEAIGTRHARGWGALKGWDQMSAPLRVTKVSPFTGKARSGLRIDLVHVNRAVWNPVLARARSGDLPGWHTYEGIERDAEYRAELFGEVPRSGKDRKGKRITLWVEVGPNHRWDLEAYALAYAHHRRLAGPRTIWGAETAPVTEALPVGSDLPGTPTPPAPEPPAPVRRYVPIAERRVRDSRARA